MSDFGSAEFGPAVFGGGSSGPVGLLLEVDAETTSEARRLLARSTTDGTAFRVIEFSLGQGGLDPFDYRYVTAVNPDATVLEQELPTAFGGNPTKAVTEYERPNPGAACAYCLIDNSEANDRLSEIAIWAEIKYSPYQFELAPTPYKFIAAIAHFPLICKNSSMRYALRVNVQF